MRAAVYTGTKNLYQYMVISAKSLLIHSNVEKIYFLIQDDIFPYELPQIIQCIHVKQQPYFKHDGPNYKSCFTYMALIRGALTKIFPNLDTILSLDVDTIINDNISELWDLDLTNYYLAAVEQSYRSSQEKKYINGGVILLNLKKLKEDKMDDTIINALNTNHFKFDIQDCYSKYCNKNILSLPPDYNFNKWTDYKKANNKKIIHYAGINTNIWSEFKEVKKYQQISFTNIPRNINSFNTLDIIIPSYNDKEGLISTLNSIYYEELLDWLTITIIDDASSIDYTDIQQQFPKVNIIYLKENSGPGAARAVGIKSTKGTFFTFIDCGDIILSKYALLEVKDVLTNKNIYNYYWWPCIYQDNNCVIYGKDNSTPGKFYRRDTVETYNIYPISLKNGSYFAEDCSFAIAYKYILLNCKHNTEVIQYYGSQLPIYKAVTNLKSLTRSKRKQPATYKLQPLVENGIYVIKILQAANIQKELLIRPLNQYLVDIYKIFLTSIIQEPDQAFLQWQHIRKFYYQVYKKYLNLPQNKDILSLTVAKKLKFFDKAIKHPNLNKFLQDLEENEFCPSYYLTFTQNHDIINK